MSKVTASQLTNTDHTHTQHCPVTRNNTLCGHHVSAALYMTLEYIKNYLENIMLSRTMCYCIKMMFLLFLFGASRKTTYKNYTCPSKFSLINIVNLYKLYVLYCITYGILKINILSSVGDNEFISSS